jgi:hypothetical protein
VLRDVRGQLVIEDVQIDAPGPREVLVRTAAAGCCHSDLHFMEGLYRTPIPAVVGHESAGVVEAVGSDVSYVQPEEGDPSDLKAGADFTDVLAEDNPGWRIDINDEVIGRWRGESGMEGGVTLIWGRPLVRGAVAATAEIETECVDQEAISDERFTLIALDALVGYGDDIFLEVKLWSRRAQELAAESLYDEGDADEVPPAKPEA